MKITSKIKMDLQQPNSINAVSAVQSDTYSRNLQIELYSGGVPLIIADDVDVIIRYRKFDGKGGEYNRLPDGGSAWTAKGHILTVVLAPQMLVHPGSVRVSISLCQKGSQLTTFPILLDVLPIANGTMDDLPGSPSINPVAPSGNNAGYMDLDNTIILDNAENGKYSILPEDWNGPIEGVSDITVEVTQTIKEYPHLISINCAPQGTKRLGIYNSNGTKIDSIRLTRNYRRTFPNEKQYSFGALSDVHYQYDTAADDFRQALSYLIETEDVAFTCISGDLTASGTEWELMEYRAAVEAHSPNTPVYAVTGNHEAIAGLDLANIIQNYTGKPLYYSFTHGDDVFIMVGIVGNAEGKIFAPGTLQWLYETLEANRNKRCFIFEHVRPQDGCGNALGVYLYDIWGGSEATVFESLMKHYPNTILFHGHSHLKLQMQLYSDLANYDNIFGNHSFHIPSLSVPRDITSVVNPTIQDVYASSEGYVVDVYDNGIMLKGRDFTAGKYLAIATYWLDTPLKTVEAGTYKDLTGTIDTSNIVKLSYLHNHTISSTTGEISAAQGQSITDLFPIDSDYDYLITTANNRKDTGISCFAICFDAAGDCLGRTTDLMSSSETPQTFPHPIPFLPGTAGFRLRCFRNGISEVEFEGYFMITRSIHIS